MSLDDCIQEDWRLKVRVDHEHLDATSSSPLIEMLFSEGRILCEHMNLEALPLDVHDCLGAKPVRRFNNALNTTDEAAWSISKHL